MKLNIQKETIQLEAVVLEIAESSDAILRMKDAHDPNSPLFHQNRAFPLENDLTKDVNLLIAFDAFFNSFGKYTRS